MLRQETGGALNIHRGTNQVMVSEVPVSQALSLLARWSSYSCTIALA
jgi:hypothetical protein